jgi:hypothetical protein
MFIPMDISFLNGLDSGLKLVSLIMTGIIFWQSYRLYSLYSMKDMRYFLYAFLFFTIGNLVSFLIDVFIYIGILQGGLFQEIVFLRTTILIFLALRYGAFLLGFLSLFIIALGYPNRKVQLAIFLLTAIAGYFASFKGLFYHVTVTLFTLFILIDLWAKYRRTRKRPLLLYFTGMLFLYLAYLCYVYFLVFKGFYWVGHGLEIASYIFFIWSLFAVFRKNEAKKRTT